MSERQRANQCHSVRAKRSTELDLAQRVLAPLWRGLVGYRAMAFGYAAVLMTTAWSDYRQPVLAAAVLEGVGLWTVSSTYGYLRPPRGGPGCLARPGDHHGRRRRPRCWWTPRSGSPLAPRC